MLRLNQILLISYSFSFTALPSSGIENAKNATSLFLHEVTGENVVEFAKKYLGTPYYYASSNPEKGFDCSGFVNFVFKNFAIELPRSSRDFKDMGPSLTPEEFKVGDILVFYSFQNSKNIGHVGIICEANGMQSKFIHSASGNGKGVIISELESATYGKRLYQCIDVIP